MAAPLASAVSTFLRTGLPAADGIPDFGLTAVNPLILRLFPILPSKIGLRLRVLARFSGSRSDPELSLSLSSFIGLGDFPLDVRAIERVMGPK